MDWSVVIAKLDEADSTEHGHEMDPFQRVFDASESIPGPAEVTMSVGSSVDYGNVKCTASVTIRCIQTEAYIDIAAEVAFTKAQELCDDALSVFGVPPMTDSAGDA